MTENEAIAIIRDHFEVHHHDNRPHPLLDEAVGMAIKALEEVQQYRAIGTPEECRAAVEKQPTAYDPDKVTEQLKYNITLFIDKDGEKVLLDDAIEIVKAGGNADLLIDRAKSKSGERIPYDGKWK